MDFFVSSDGLWKKEYLPLCLESGVYCMENASRGGEGVSLRTLVVWAGQAPSQTETGLPVGVPPFSPPWLAFAAWPELWENSVNPQLYSCFYSAAIWVGESRCLCLEHVWKLWLAGGC